MLSDADVRRALDAWEVSASAEGYVGPARLDYIGMYLAREVLRHRKAAREIIQRHADIKEAVDYLAPDLSAEDLALNTGLEQGAFGAAQIAAKALEGSDD